ncbi:hypothetical protein MTR_2g028500 [Medicago truncatula]|uniref:Uncharacterized protein n=1 Tax=Medicago truncatula TaxID=3880 RepID=A2Q2K0_MEDTR|nr:hypothetical protein MtrDRAFT_AC151000g23v2 [Medicago truncatula]AES64678.1 hypothetical protein MTR_2g028500 [Medicago truncatula]
MDYVIDLLHEAGRSHCTTKLCDRYQFSAAMTLLSWFISSGRIFLGAHGSHGSP